MHVSRLHPIGAIALIAQAALLTPTAPAAERVTLAKEGKPAATLVIAEKPTRVAQLAALELQHHIKLITGATLPIVRGERSTKGARVLIGETAATRKMGLTSEGFGPQEYLLRFGKDTLVLIGRDEQDYGDVQYLDADDPKTWKAFTTWPKIYHHTGTMYAVYEFLERFCNVRWFTPTECGADIPERSTLTVGGGDVRRSPVFKTRIAMGNPMSEGWDQATGLWSPKSDEFKQYEAAAYAKLHRTFPNSWHYIHAKRGWMRLWLFRMRNIGENMSCNHSLYGYYDRFWQRNKRTPDWFVGKKPGIFAKGYRGKPPQMCYTNPDLVKLVARDARDYFDGKVIWHNTLIRKDRREAWGENMFAIEPMDNGSYCKCAECRKWFPPGTDRESRRFFGTGRDSNYIFQFVNAVARELAKTHPSRYICTLAYGSHLGYPDKVKLEPNVVVFFCFDHNRMPYHRTEYAHGLKLYREWVGKHDGPLYLWLYYCFPQDFGRGNWRVFPGLFAHTIGKQFRMFHADGIKGMFHCGYGQEVEAYVTFKLMDDPTRSVDELLDEFFSRQFGRAGVPLRRFYEEVESIYVDPAHYHNQNLTHQTEEIAWGMLGTQKRMARLAGYIRQARALVRTELEKKRLDLFEQTTWRYMTSGKERYQKRKSAWVNIPRLRGFHATIDAPGGDPAKVDWREATSLTWWRFTNTPENSLHRLRGRLKHDGTHLYVCLDEWTDTSRLKADKGVIGGDYFQVVLAAKPKGGCHELLINPDGHVLRRRYKGAGRRSSGWRSGAVVRSKRTNDLWTVRIALPLDRAVPGGAKLGGNIYLNLARRNKKGDDDAVWVPTLGEPITHTNRMAHIHLDTKDATVPTAAPDAAALASLDRQVLVGRWTFEDEAITTVADASGHGVTGRTTHRVKRVDGLRGKALHFDAAVAGPKSVEFGNPPAARLTDAVTIEAWVWPNEDFRSYIAYYPAVLGKGYGGGAYSLHTRPNRWPWFNITTADGKRHYYQPTDVVLVEAAWNHLVATYDGSQMRVFVNGREAGKPKKVGGKMIVSDHPLTLGALPGCNPLVGRIDEVSLYGRAMTPGEIFSRWRAALAGGGK